MDLEFDTWLMIVGGLLAAGSMGHKTVRRSGFWHRGHHYVTNRTVESTPANTFGIILGLLLLALGYFLQDLIDFFFAVLPFLLATIGIGVFIGVGRKVGYVKSGMIVGGSAVTLMAVIMAIDYFGGGELEDMAKDNYGPAEFAGKTARQGGFSKGLGEASSVDISPALSTITIGDQQPADLGALYGEHSFNESSFQSVLQLIKDPKSGEFNRSDIIFGRGSGPAIFDIDDVGQPVYFTRGPTLFINSTGTKYGVERSCFAMIDRYDSKRLVSTTVCLAPGGGSVESQSGVITLSRPLRAETAALFSADPAAGQVPTSLQGLWSAGESSCSNLNDNEGVFVGASSLTGNISFSGISVWGLEATGDSNLLELKGFTESYSTARSCKGNAEKLSGHYHVSLQCGNDDLKFVLCKQQKMTARSIKRKGKSKSKSSSKDMR